MSYQGRAVGLVDTSDVCAWSGNANTQRARTNGPKALKRHFIGFPPRFFFQAIEKKGIVQACADGKPTTNRLSAPRGNPSLRQLTPGQYTTFEKKDTKISSAGIDNLVN
jgi:hypothetical protein